jgi:hypothetical protein
VAAPDRVLLSSSPETCTRAERRNNMPRGIRIQAASAWCGTVPARSSLGWAALENLLFLFYCWAGIRGQGGNLLARAGGRWRSWRDVANDVGVALPFWIRLGGRRANWVLGPSQGEGRVSGGAANGGGGSGLGAAFGNGRLLRGIDGSRLCSASLAAGERQRRCRGAWPRMDLRIRAFVSGIESGDGHRPAGYFVWKDACCAPHSSREYHRPSLGRTSLEAS